MQEPKGGGLSSAFGGSGLDTAFGASIGRKMSSFTVYLAVFFLILTVALAILGKTDAGALPGSALDGFDKGAAQEQPEEPKDAPKQEPEKEPGQDAPPGDKQPPGAPENKGGSPEKEPGKDATPPAVPGKDG